MGKLKVAMTGVTGLLGRNLFFEIIKKNLDHLDDLEVFALGRKAGGLSLKERIAEIVREDGRFYCGTDRTEEILARVTSMEMDLVQDKLRLSPQDYSQLKLSRLDYFFHVAALTDFRDTPTVRKSLYDTNVYGTKQVLELAATLQLGEFSYVGSAYSCGKVSGVILPDDINLDQEFRNPYEKTKLEAEMLVREFARSRGVKCRYFRPSTICGRLIEPPLGAICKFDVFYSWAAWFLRMKMKFLKEGDDFYQTPVRLDMRVCYNMKSGLNIVPADYAAKVIYETCMRHAEGDSYHLVNAEETPHDLYVSLILRRLNIMGSEHTDNIPVKKNQLEKIYYKTAGAVFTPYVFGGPELFCVKSLSKIIREADLHCPCVGGKNFPVLLDFAIKNNFGMGKLEKIREKIRGHALI